METAEVIIVGGGPGGSACARRLHQLGISCLILDRKTFPRNKVCAGWITPEVVSALEFSPDTYPHSFMALRRIIFHLHGITVPVKTRQYSIRRYEFDRWLLERAGVPVRHHRVRTIWEANGFYLIDDRYRCRYLVGAAGTYCPVYRTFFRQRYPRPRPNLITTLEAEFPQPRRSPECHLWFFENHLPGYSWYVPKGNGYVNVGLGGYMLKLQAGRRNLRHQWDYFTRRLAALGLVEQIPVAPRGYNYYLRSRTTPVVQRERVYLVGDSAGLATLDLGEGIGPAVASGIRAAESIATGAEYNLQSVPRYSLPGIIRAGFGPAFKTALY
jgi:flavin-dependent dehydrogenase